MLTRSISSRASRATTHIRFASLLLLVLVGTAPPLLAQSDDGFEPGPDDIPDNSLRMKPKFSRPSAGIGLAFGFGLTDLHPDALDPNLGGEFVPTGFDLYFIANGILVGGSWTTFDLYDPGELYNELTLDYGGILLGYDQSLFYGRMSLRLSMMIGGGSLTMVKNRPDITYDPVLNSDGRKVFEKVRDQGFFMFRPAVGLGYSPIDFLQFRTETGFMYPTSDDKIDDIREPFVNLQVVFGPRR